jgi:two-component system sensor histidine kinase VicK
MDILGIFKKGEDSLEDNKNFLKEKDNFNLNKLEFKKVLDILPLGTIIYDKDFKIVYFNKSAEEIFKIKSDFILNKQIKISDVQKEELKTLVQVIFPSLAPVLVLQSKENEDPVIEDISFGDPELFLRVYSSKIYNQNLEPVFFIKMIYDKTVEVNLLKSKDEFITIASHQLRTPLNELRWALESVLSDKSIQGTTKEILENSLISIERLSSLTENILNISKIEEGKWDYNFEQVNFVEILQNILNQVEPQIRRLNLDLYFNKPEEKLPEIYVDKQKIYIAIFNILDNAAKYNVKNGKIFVEVKLTEDNKFIQTIIKDTGVGIPKEELKNIFTKFFRSKISEKINTEGSGLGLYVSKKIIENHGGKIMADSEEGRGTTITFYLPIKKD